MENDKNMKELYRWQKECLEKWFENKGRGMVQAVTGTGKTFLALSAAGLLDEQQGGRLRVKIIVPTGELMRQWERALREYLLMASGGEEDAGSIRGMIGLRGGGHKSRPDRKYMIYVINSARYELARQILGELREGVPVLMVADECHHYESGQNRLIFEFLPHLSSGQAARFFSMGLSATLPPGKEKSYLASVLGREVYSYNMPEASAQNIVSPYDIYHIELSLSEDEAEEYEELSQRILFLYKKLAAVHPFLRKLGIRERFLAIRELAGDKDMKAAKEALVYLRLIFQRKKLVCLASGRVACACDLIRRLPGDKRVVVFGERISQAEELYQRLKRSFPEKVGRYHSQMGQQANKNVIDRFRAGEIRILIACKALDEGLDIPEVSVGIILSGTSVERQRTQRMGRIIRKCEEKGRASLYYLHVAETTEDVCFLPDPGSGRVFELAYDLAGRSFSRPWYEAQSEAVLKKLAREGADGRKMKEAMRCLDLGIIRSDWMLAASEIEKNIREAKYREDKNYWACMRMLSERAEYKQKKQRHKGSRL